MPTLSLHTHTVYSQRDSIARVDAIVEKAAKNGATHFCVTDHGTAQGWLAVRDACNKNKLVPMYGIEFYVNDFIGIFKQIQQLREAAPKKNVPDVTIRAIHDLVLPFMTPKQSAYFVNDLKDKSSLPETAKQLFSRLGYGYEHLVGVALTEEGRQNLIRLHNIGWKEGNYFKPQVTTDQCLTHSAGVIWTTACLGGPLAKRLKWDPEGNEARAYLKRWNKNQLLLEVQPLDLLDQELYNSELIKLSVETGFNLVLSQDNHHVDEEDWISHRAMMLSQNDLTIDRIEAVYRYKGRELPFSDLKKELGIITTAEMEFVLWEGEGEIFQLVQKAGHHYGDVRLHWRTNDDIRRECEIHNDELLPVLDRCFEMTDAVCALIKDIPWPTKHRIPYHKGAREQALKICAERLKQLDKCNMQYVEWLAKEDKVITACGFWDYIWSLYKVITKVQEEGIPIGYARGSGGGCLVMFLLGIIRVDPVKYGLYFERFLNPARLGLDPKTLERVKPMISCPDADLDFSSLKRQRVIEIAEEIFGKDSVVPVGTIGEAKLRTAMADLCRVLKITQAEFIPVSKELPEDPNGKLSFTEAMKTPAFADFMAKYPAIAKLLPPMVGSIRSTGQHASGICIADVPVADAVPVVRAGAKEGGNIVTAFGESGSERALESIGFVKFDFLATDTVDHVSLCARNLHEEHLAAGGTSWVKAGELMLYPEQIPHFTMNDPNVMKEIFHTGNTDGIFQMEESIGKQMAQLVKPDTVEEISDISTMIRPGCLQADCHWFVREGDQIVNKEGSGLHFLYAARKSEESINPPPPLPSEVLEVLKPTHYCCIYQEQMMFLIEVVTGGKMSLGEGDIYRRAIEHSAKGKEEFVKVVEEMDAKMRAIGAYPPEIVDAVCNIIKGGAAYSFNKAHALSYSLFSYAQAWFKFYYPHIFFAAHVSLLAAKNKLEKAHKIINNARSMGIEIRPPHVLHSQDRATWSQDKKIVYLPFTVVKGLKDETAAAIPRLAVGCTKVIDFILKTRKEPVIRKNHLIDLAMVGGFDGMDIPNRIKIVALINYILERTTAKHSEESIISYWEEAEKTFAVMYDMDSTRKAKAEIEVFGSFINESPLDRMILWMEAQGWMPLSQIEPHADEEFRVYFLVTAVTKKVHKTGNSIGKEWLKLTCWDGLGVGEVSIWAHDLEGNPDENIKGYRPIIEPNIVYLAIVQADGERPVSLARRKDYTLKFPVPRETLMPKRV